MTIYWATKLRGFLKHISERSSDVHFLQKEFYETSSRLHLLKSKLIRSRLLDLTGTFQTVSVAGKDCDAYGSYNRFLNADKPYFIYLENPTALYHYALGRISLPRGKKRFKKCLEDKNLKYIVCMNEACFDTFEKVNMKIPESVRVKTIYPLVPENLYATDEVAKEKCYSEVLECLYCAQGKRFYTKGGSDVLEAVARLQDAGCRIRLTVVTNVDALDEKTRGFIDSHEGIDLYDFSFSYDEMERLYAKTAVLIQPSSDDSCPLTVLEALKGGCAVLGSKLYAIPEMVEDRKNGLLVDPKYWSFSPDNIPNPSAWGRANKRRLSKKRSEKYIADIECALRSMYDDRDMLYSFAKGSLEISRTKFGEEKLCREWQEVWETLKGNEKNEA